MQPQTPQFRVGRVSAVYEAQIILFLSVVGDTGQSPSARKIARDTGLELIGKLSALMQTDTDMFVCGPCVYTGLSHTSLDPFLSRFSPEDTSRDHQVKASI